VSLPVRRGKWGAGIRWSGLGPGGIYCDDTPGIGGAGGVLALNRPAVQGAGFGGFCGGVCWENAGDPSLRARVTDGDGTLRFMLMCMDFPEPYPLIMSERGREDRPGQVPIHDSHQTTICTGEV